MPMYVAEFFEVYADVFSRYDLEAAADLFGLPSIVMTDEKKLIMVRRGDVIAEVDRVMESCKQRGIVKVEPTIEQVLKMSDTMKFCNVSWSFKDGEENEVFKASDSFTLQRKGESFEVVAMVVSADDEIYYQSVTDHGTSNK